jgi:hypothetical protein
MPFYALPGDLLLLAPLYFTDPAAYTKLAVGRRQRRPVRLAERMGHADRAFPVHARGASWGSRTTACRATTS